MKMHWSVRKLKSRSDFAHQPRSHETDAHLSSGYLSSKVTDVVREEEKSYCCENLTQNATMAIKPWAVLTSIAIAMDGIGASFGCFAIKPDEGELKLGVPFIDRQLAESVAS